MLVFYLKIPKCLFYSLGVISKKNSIFKDIVQIGGREAQNILSKIEALYFVGFITQSGQTKCLSVCNPDPQRVIGMIVNASFKA